VLAKRRGSKKSTKPTIFSSSVSEDTSPISLTHMREVDVTDFETQHKPNSAHSINLDPDYSILQPMTLNVPNFDPASYGHHNVKGNGSCLVNVCAYALLGTESKSASLRDSIVKFVQDCNQELFSMRSVCSETQNLTMEILDGMADEESVDSPFFISKVNEQLSDSELEEHLVFSHKLRIRQSPEKLDFMTNQYATWIKDMYIKYSLGKHKKSVKDGSDTQVLLYFLCLIYDIGFIIWVNGSQNADAVKITYSDVIHRNVQHGNLNSLFPFIHILNTPPGYYLQGNRYHLQHFFILLPSDNMYNTYTTYYTIDIVYYPTCFMPITFPACLTSYPQVFSY
jgi:hypothetical protein